MKLDIETFNLEQKLAEFCLGRTSADGINARADRLPVYRRLVFNQIFNTLKKTYPIACALLPAGTFKTMAEDFFAHQECHSPLLWKMPEGFYHYACAQAWDKKYNSPALLDLLLLEWLEIEVFMMEDKELPSCSKTGRVETDILVMNPHFRLNRFCYPVFSRPLNNAAEEPGDYFLLTFRHNESLKVNFLALSRFFAFCLEILSQAPKCAEEVCADAEILIGEKRPQSAPEFFEHALACGAIAGFLQVG